MADHDCSPKEWTHFHSVRHGPHTLLSKHGRRLEKYMAPGGKEIRKWGAWLWNGGGEGGGEGGERKADEKIAEEELLEDDDEEEEEIEDDEGQHDAINRRHTHLRKHSEQKHEFIRTASAPSSASLPPTPFQSSSHLSSLPLSVRSSSDVNVNNIARGMAAARIEGYKGSEKQNVLAPRSQTDTSAQQSSPQPVPSPSPSPDILVASSPAAPAIPALPRHFLVILAILRVSFYTLP